MPARTLFPVRRVAVIGAGISGVNSAAHLLAEGLDVTVFERSPVAGGVWVFDSKLPLEPTYPSAKPSEADSTFFHVPDNVDPHIFHAPPGACYEALKNNVATELLEVSYNKWKPGTESFTLHANLAEYIQDTAAKSGVRERTLFDTKVDHLEKVNGVWKVTTSTWDYSKKTATARDWTFDAVVVASGHYHAPWVPGIEGLSAWKTAFPERVQHSKGYRSARGFENQTVLLIGGSASATDIAVEVAPVAKKVWQSTRNGRFDHPESVLPENAERIGEVRSFGILPSDASDSTTSSAAAIPATVTLHDGRTLEGIDRIVLATGYQFTLPFLPHLHRDGVAPEAADEQVLVTSGQELHNLHKDIFYIADPTLAFVGVPFFTATFSLFEFQAITVAAVFAGKTALPSEAEQRSEYRQRQLEKGFGKPFHSLWKQDDVYARELMAWVNEGRAPADRKPDGYSDEWLVLREKMALVKDRKNIHFEENTLNVKA